MTKADLHIHSNISDGSDTIPEIIEKAETKGLDIIAITDHDTFSHIAQTPKTNTLRIIPALEVSAVDTARGIHVHLLGYNVQAPEVVTALTQPLLEARHKNTLRQIDLLRENGYQIDIDKLRPADGKYLYKQHVMDYLVSTGQTDEMFGSLFKSMFKNKGNSLFRLPYIDALDAVEAIRKAGGAPVLAHAGQQKNFYMIPALAAHGLLGLELNHPSNCDNDKAILRQAATTHHLFLTGGSDYHGRYERPHIDIGDFLSEESGIAAVC